MPRNIIGPQDKDRLVKKDLYLAGFTLLEVLVSIIILVLCLTGMTSLFLSGKRLLFHAQYRTVGGELGRRFLDHLQMEVRQDGAGGSCLSGDGSSGCPGPQTISNLTWTPTYNIEDVTEISNSNLRRIILNVQLPKPSQ